jgi:moderate conductance mechanosensitive channel
MSSLPAYFTENAASTLFRLLLLLLIALLVNRALRLASGLLVRPAASQSRSDQAREQQTRALANLAYAIASKVVWTVAALTAMDRLGISPVPALLFLGLAGLAVGFGAQNLVRDVIAGIYIVLEDQYVVGDTVQILEVLGKVEQLTLRKTVVRDVRGAVVTVSNGEIRTVANLSRDWSQAFVDVALAPEVPLERPLSALESAAAELRGDAAWSQALIEGPRVLGVQGYDRNASVVRVQLKTLPLRQEEISRELRRRIQIEFQKQGIPLTSVLRYELANARQPAEGTLPPSPPQ